MILFVSRLLKIPSQTGRHTFEDGQLWWAPKSSSRSDNLGQKLPPQHELTWMPNLQSCLAHAWEDETYRWCAGLWPPSTEETRTLYTWEPLALIFKSGVSSLWLDSRDWLCSVSQSRNTENVETQLAYTSRAPVLIISCFILRKRNETWLLAEAKHRNEGQSIAEIANEFLVNKWWII